MRRIGDSLARAYTLWWRDFNRGQKFLLGVMVVSILAVFAAIFFANRPFEPFTFYGYSVEGGREKCPGERVRLLTDREVEESLLGDVRSVEVLTSWESQDGLLTPVVRKVLPLEPMSRKTVPSRLLRTSPRIEGEWMVDSRLTIDGSMLGIDRSQVVNVRSEVLIEVLDENDPRCEDANVGNMRNMREASV